MIGVAGGELSFQRYDLTVGVTDQVQACVEVHERQLRNICSEGDPPGSKGYLLRPRGLQE